MAISLSELTRFYTREELRFSVEEERRCIRLRMQIRSIGQSVEFRVFLPNEDHVLFYTYLPMRVAEDKRQEAAEFFARANYNLHDGNFELDMNDGEVRYKTCLYLGENDRASDEMLGRMTYVGFGMVEQYAPALFAVLYAGKTVRDAIADAEEKDD